MFRNRHVLRKPEGEGEGGGGGGAAPAPAPAAPAPAPAASAPAPAAPAPAPAAPAPAPAAAPAAPAEVKATWPENWREIGSKGDAKRQAQLARYGSVEATIDALFAAQDRIRSGELKPVLGKNASADEVKEWREAHGIPASADKYDLGKDVKIADVDKPFMDVLFKAAHDSNQTPAQLAATIKTFQSVRDAAFAAQSDADKAKQTDAEENLRAEWGPEYRRNVNLIGGLLDGNASAKLKESILGGRLADGTPIGSSPEAMRMLLSLALIQNPTGTVVPGGGGENGEGIKTELEKLQKLPAKGKTEAQSQRERDLIDMAVKSGFMDSNGGWKK
jgi:hypothetical protein